MKQAKPFREIVGEFTRLIQELDAMCERDPILRKRIKEISRLQLEEFVGMTVDHKHSTRMMLAFMVAAMAAVEQREKEVLYADRSTAGGPQGQDHGKPGGLSHARGSR